MGLGAALAPAACTLLVGDDAEQCSTTSDCAGLGAEFANTVCSGAGRCVPQSLLGVGGGGAGGAAPACTRNGECLTVSSAVCRQGACVPLADVAAGCDVSYGTVLDNDDENLLVGLLAPRSRPGPLGLLGNSLAAAYVMAREDYAAEVPRTAPLAPIVIRCDEGADPGRAVEHLVDKVGVQMVVGPVLAENFAAVVGRTRPRGVVLVSPTVDDRALVDADQADGLVWSCRPNREHVARYYVQAFEKALEVFRQRDGRFTAAKALLVVNNDPTTTAFLQQVQSELEAKVAAGEPGGFLRTIDYDWSSAASTNFDALANRIITEQVTGLAAELRPNLIVFPTAIDSVEKAITAIESRWPLGTPVPAYFLDEPFNDVGSVVALNSAPLVRTLGVRPYSGPVSRQAYADYVSAYKRLTGSGPLRQSEYAFDCFYESFYALSAAAPRTGSVVRLAPGGEAFRRGVGLIEAVEPTDDVLDTVQEVPAGHPGVATFFQTLLSEAKLLDVVGTTGELNFGAKNYPAGRGELYCFAANGNACGAGTVFDAVTGAPSPDPDPDATCVCAQ